MKRLATSPEILPAIENCSPTPLQNGKGAIQPSVEPQPPQEKRCTAAPKDSLRLYYVSLALFLFCLLLSAFSLPAHAAATTGTCGPGPMGGLIDWWKFDETSGTSASDSSGNGHTATMANGATFAAGEINNAASLSQASNQYAQASLSLGSGDITVGGWIYPKSYGDGYDTFFTEVTAGFVTTFTCIFSHASGDHMYCGDNGSTTTNTAGTIPLKQWTHFTAVRTAGGLFTLYINGVQDGGANQNGGATSSSGTTVFIGANHAGGDTFDGSVDDVRLYNRALSATEVAQLYAATDSPGDFRYSQQWRTIQYCDGGNWVGTGPAQYAAPAVHFDGAATYLSLAGDNATADGTTATGSFWFRRTGGSGAIRDLYTIDKTNTKTFELYFDAANLIHIVGYNTGGVTKELDINGATAYTDSNWHHIAFTFDLGQTCTTGTSNSAGCQIYGDGVAQNVTLTTFTNTALDYSTASTKNTTVGANSNGSANWYNGDLADFWLDLGTGTSAYLDLRTASNLAKFYNTGTSGPVYLGADGSTPIGTAPEVFLSDATLSTWPTNKGAGSGFTLNGTLTNAGDTSGASNVTSGLVGWWKLDDASSGTSTTAVDSSGQGNTGTTQNSPVWTGSGKIGNALTFNGTNQYVSAGDPASLRLAASWTVSAWVNPSAIPSSGNISIMVSKSTAVGTNYDLVLDNGHYNAGLGWAVDFNSTGCCDDHFAKYVTPISAGTWYHVVGVYDSVGQTVTLYLNGTSVASSSVAGFSPRSGSGSNLAIGAIGAGGNYFTAGTIDDARVYNRALSATEVSALYLQKIVKCSCASPAGCSGDIKYNTDYHVPQYCDGAAWQPMGPVPGAGGAGCTGGAQGDVLYNKDKHVLQYCDGANWIAAGGGPPAAPEGGLVGWWKLDDGSSGTTPTTAVDSSGNANTATLINSPVWTGSGKIGNALSVDGAANRHADTASPSTALQLSGSWTVSAWIKLAALPVLGGFPQQMVGMSRNSDSCTNYGLYLDVGHYNAGYGWAVAFNDTGSCSNRFAKLSGTPSLNTWYHLAGVYDSVAQTETLYVNGVSVATLSTTGLSPATGAGVLSMFSNASPYPSGVIDDSRVYNRALSASEVWDLYLATGGT